MSAVRMDLKLDRLVAPFTEFKQVVVSFYSPLFMELLSLNANKQRLLLSLKPSPYVDHIGPAVDTPLVSTGLCSEISFFRIAAIAQSLQAQRTTVYYLLEAKLHT